MERRPQRAEGRYADAAEAVILARAGTTRATVGRLLTPITARANGSPTFSQRGASSMATGLRPRGISMRMRRPWPVGDLTQRGGSFARYAEQQLFERLDRKPGEREEIERLLDQVNKAVDLREKMEVPCQASGS